MRVVAPMMREQDTNIFWLTFEDYWFYLYVSVFRSNEVKVLSSPSCLREFHSIGPLFRSILLFRLRISEGLNFGMTRECWGHSWWLQGTSRLRFGSGRALPIWGSWLSRVSTMSFWLFRSTLWPSGDGLVLHCGDSPSGSRVRDDNTIMMFFSGSCHRF